MRPAIVWALVLVALVAGGVEGSGLAQVGGTGTGPCPDVRASQDDGHVQDGPQSVLCMGVYYAYGITIQVRERLCPLTRTRYPARGVCRGEESEGTRCVYVGELEVQRERCRCAFLELFGIRLPVLVCECEPYGVAGHVPDARTEACRE